MSNRRKQQILSLLNSSGFLSAQDLAKHFNVSTETIRRDLVSMEEEGLLKKIRGGAVATTHTVSEIVYQNRKTLFPGEKREIARAAAELVKDGDTVIIMSGTTTLAMAEFLAEKKDLTVITNSILLAAELANYESINIHCLGGHVRNGNYSISGSLALQNAGIFNADKLITGVGGLTAEQGITDFILDEAMLLRCCMEAAAEVIALADHSKFDTSTMYNVCPAKRIQHLVTSSLVPSSTLEQYHKLGIQIHTAALPQTSS